jgi:hypothetical protein
VKRLPKADGNVLTICSEISVLTFPEDNCVAHAGKNTHADYHQDRCDYAGQNENQNHPRENPAQPPDICHCSDGRRNREKHKRHDYGKKQVQENIAEGFEEGCPLFEYQA